MATSFMYRRNGRYYARLRIPKQYQPAFAQCTHLRESLGTADINIARLRVHEVLLRWRRDFERLKAMLDVDRVAAGSPLLVGDGLITVGSASRESGIPVADIVTEALNRRLELRVEGKGWWGTEMPADELEHEHGGPGEVGSYSPPILVLNSADGREQSLVSGTLYLRFADLAVATPETLATCLLFRDRRRTQAIIFPLPGLAIPLHELLIDKADAEQIRKELAAKVTPEMLQASKAAHAAVAEARTAAAPAKHKYGEMRAGELLDRFFAAKASDWGSATKMDMTGMCGAFVELMDDPALADIDGAMVLDYKSRLARLPNHVGTAKRKTRATTFSPLLDALPEMGRMGPDRVHEYISKLSEFLGWATKQGFIDRNPAAGATARKKKTKREQDERQAMSAENLAKIFSVIWFELGKGDRTARGAHWSFQPHYYWLPLMGLFVGGRLNELSQLYLDDFKSTPSGCWFVDFNTDRPDKRDLDESDTLAEGEKRLKTVNAVRVVPLHSRLIELGLLEYVFALRANGEHQRLFPELPWDDTKGYSKRSSRWFNELFIGKKLKVKRDSKQVFHSLRHNFISTLIELDVPERVVSELAGHERGKTMSGKRYAKDRAADKLAIILRAWSTGYRPSPNSMSGTA